MAESTAILSIEAVVQVYNQTSGFVDLGGNANHNANLSIEVDRCIRNASWCSSRKYTLELYGRPSAPLELKIRMQRTRGTEDNNVRLRHVEPARGPLRHAAPVGIAPTTRFPIWTRLSRRKVRAPRRLFAGCGSCLRDLWHTWRIRDCRSA